MKNISELFKDCPKKDKVIIKIKGYKKFVADETKLRWIAWKVCCGEIPADDVIIYEPNGVKNKFQKNGCLVNRLSCNIYECDALIWMGVMQEQKKQMLNKENK